MHVACHHSVLATLEHCKLETSKHLARGGGLKQRSGKRTTITFIFQTQIYSVHNWYRYAYFNRNFIEWKFCCVINKETVANFSLLFLKNKVIQKINYNEVMY